AITTLRNNDFFFLILIGATLTGLGLGIIFKARGSTAGSDIFAAVAQKRWGVKPGTAFMVVDFFVISFAGVAIHLKNLPGSRPALVLTLYAFFLLFVSSKLVDVILDGFDYARSALIISDKSQEIAAAIMNELSRGATAIEGRGLYTDKRREILYTVLTRKEVGTAMRLVKRIDPKAFIIINTVHEVQGEGFRLRR
ncbi:MAG: YitT family protein, partial [Candidatus Aminicenantes bacterium]|nr:YitT family protein [Candidatus Aminicenantes bacterium]